MLPKAAKRAATFPDRLTFHVLFSVTRMKIHNGKSFGILFYTHKLECMKIMFNVYICIYVHYVQLSTERTYFVIYVGVSD